MFHDEALYKFTLILITFSYLKRRTMRSRVRSDRVHENVAPISTCHLVSNHWLEN